MSPSQAPRQEKTGGSFPQLLFVSRVAHPQAVTVPAAWFVSLKHHSGPEAGEVPHVTIVCCLSP